MGPAKTLCIFLFVVAFGVGCQTTSSVHPQFAARAQRLTNLVVLPVPATAITVKVIGVKEEPFQQVEEFCQRVRAQVAQQWEQRGFKVAQSKLEMRDWGTITNCFEDRDVWMRMQLQRAYQSLARVGGFDRAKLVRPEASLLAEYEGADGLVFVCASTVIESETAKGTRWTHNALAIVVGVGLAALTGGNGPDLADSPEGCSLEVILVEGHSGEILWRSWVTPKSLKGPKLDAAMQKVFARYPKEGQTTQPALHAHE